jgi:hypothetical protein
VSIRRLFWQGAAALLTLAALIAISGILTGSFDETQAKILGNVAVAFVTASTALAALACLDRGVMRELGVAALVAAAATFVCWTLVIWQDGDVDGLWKVTGLVTVWLFALLAVTTLRLLTRGRGTAVNLFRATVGCTLLAAVVATLMILFESGHAWQLLAISGILAVLGYLLTPIAQRLGRTAGT